MEAWIIEQVRTFKKIDNNNLHFYFHGIKITFLFFISVQLHFIVSYTIVYVSKHSQIFCLVEN